MSYEALGLRKAKKQFLDKLGIGLSIKAKLKVLLAFLCIPFTLFVYFLYTYSSKIIFNSAINTSRQILEQTESYLNNYFNDMERIILPVVSNNLTWEFLDNTSEDPYIRYMVTKPIQEDLFPSIMINKPDISSLSLISETAVVSSGYSYQFANERYKRYNEKSTNVGKIEFEEISVFNNIPVVTMILRFHNPRSKKGNGMLIVDIRTETISQIVGRVKIGRTGRIMIADHNGHIICHPDPKIIGTCMFDAGIPRFREGESSYFISGKDRNCKLFVFKHMQSTGWIITSEVPLNEFNEELVNLRNMAVILGVLGYMVALVFVGVASLSITSPILRLQRLMKKAECGDLTIRAYTNRRDEIGNLYISFNNMVSKLDRLITEVHLSQLRERDIEIKQKQSMLEVMYSQINPHFLYNTLELINSYAILEDVMPISRMCVALAKFFRYSISHTSNIVALKDEISHTMTYLNIQKERYPYIDVSVHFEDSDISEVKAVKLMLQPIVENAFKHGYEKYGIRPELIKIGGFRKNDMYMLFVEDKGGGMDEDIINYYNRLFSGDEMQKKDISEKFDKLSHVGMINVHNRIVLTFGEGYGLRLEKAIQRGLKVWIALPYHSV